MCERFNPFVGGSAAEDERSQSTATDCRATVHSSASTLTNPAGILSNSNRPLESVKPWKLNTTGIAQNGVDAGNYLRVGATSVQLSVAGQTLKGDFFFEQGDFGKAIQGAIQSLIDDGTYDKIVTTWDIKQGAITKAAINGK